MIADFIYILLLGSCVPDQVPPCIYAETMMAKQFPHAIEDHSLRESHSFQTHRHVTLLNWDQCDLGQWALVTGSPDKTLPEYFAQRPPWKADPTQFSCRSASLLVI